MEFGSSESWTVGTFAGKIASLVSMESAIHSTVAVGRLGLWVGGDGGIGSGFRGYFDGETSVRTMMQTDMSKEPVLNTKMEIKFHKSCTEGIEYLRITR